MSKLKTTSQNLEARFEASEDVSDYFDTAAATRLNHTKARLNLDLPKWMINQIDRVAGRTGIPRQAVIKTWLSERIKADST